jgi:hypothetical protein
VKFLTIDVGPRLTLPGASEVVDVLSTDAFLRAIPNEPCVIFWHQFAETALPILGSLRREGRWPAQVRGVVIFKGAPYAGAQNEDKASRLMRENELDEEIVFIWPDVIAQRPWERDHVEQFIQYLELDPGGQTPFKALQGPRWSFSHLCAGYLVCYLQRQGRGKDLESLVDWSAARRQGREWNKSHPNMFIDSVRLSEHEQVREWADQIVQVVQIPCRLIAALGGLEHEANKLATYATWDVLPTKRLSRIAASYTNKTTVKEAARVAHSLPLREESTEIAELLHSRMIELFPVLADLESLADDAKRFVQADLSSAGVPSHTVLETAAKLAAPIAEKLLPLRTMDRITLP